MHSNRFKVAKDPEHDKLSSYIEDNPDTAAPIVGIEFITEFVGDTDIRPFYHCSIKGCCNEQGDSRQMFEHLTTYDHVISWLQEQNIADHQLSEDEEEIIKLCWKLLMSGSSPSNQSYNSINDKRLHRKCEQARLRFTKQQIESLLRKQSVDTHQRQRQMEDGGAHCNLEHTSSEIGNTSKDLLQTPDNVPMCIIKQEPEVKQEVKSPVKPFTKKPELEPNVKHESKSPLKAIVKKPEIQKLKQKERLEGKSPSSKSVLSFKEYQDKRRAEEVQIVSEKIVKDMSISSQTSVKTESLSNQERRLSASVDMLSGGSESPATSRPIVKWSFKDRVAKYVVKILQANYYVYEKDTAEQIAKKTIKIRNQQEFEKIGKMFGTRFIKDIREAYESATGSVLGLEDVDVASYGIEHEIHKYFEDKPTVEPGGGSA